MITLAQVGKEIEADGYKIAKLIRQENDVNDPRAMQIMAAYDAATAGNPDAEQVVLTLYSAWRTDNAAVVAPIASSLGHDAPTDGVATGVAPEAPQSPFFQRSGAADGAAAAAPAPTPAPAAATAPTARKPRNAWAQADIAKLTRVLVLAKKADHATAISQVASELNRAPEEVRSKAVELGLVEAPPKPTTYELTDNDKRVLSSNLLTKVVPDNVSPEIKIAMFKYVASEVRELVKSLSE